MMNLNNEGVRNIQLHEHKAVLCKNIHTYYHPAINFMLLWSQKKKKNNTYLGTVYTD